MTDPTAEIPGSDPHDRSPRVLRGFAEDWRASAVWSGEYLLAAAPTAIVHAAVTPSGQIDDESQTRPMPLGDVVEAALNGSPPPYVYLQQSPLAELSPKLVHDLDPSAVGWSSDPWRLWIGQAGVVSPLHFDYGDNVLVQIKGEKHVVLVPPDRTFDLKPGPINTSSEHQSRLGSSDDRELQRLWPDAMTFTLSDSDALFIPAYWWHRVRAMSAGLSVNRWWKPPILGLTHAGFERALRSRRLNAAPKSLYQYVDVARTTPHEVVQDFLAAGRAAGANMLLATAIRERLSAASSQWGEQLGVAALKAQDRWPEELRSRAATIEAVLTTGREMVLGRRNSAVPSDIWSWVQDLAHVIPKWAGP